MGTGLGLSICHGIVTSLGGQISAYSEPGAGTTFRVVLPTTTPRTTPIPVRRATPRRRERRRARVLVVDDEPPIANTLRELLAPEHEVVAATSGREALDAAHRSADFDVVFCDLIMPGMSGIDLYQRLREARPGLEQRIVFMTGGAFTTRAAEFLASVDNRRVEKPFSLGSSSGSSARWPAQRPRSPASGPTSSSTSTSASCPTRRRRSTRARTSRTSRAAVTRATTRRWDARSIAASHAVSGSARIRRTRTAKASGEGR